MKFIEFIFNTNFCSLNEIEIIISQLYALDFDSFEESNKVLKAYISSDKYDNHLIKKINDSIGREGRILVRASGTEDLIRVLVEHSDVKQLNYFLDYFCDNIKKH